MQNKSYSNTQFITPTKLNPRINTTTTTTNNNNSSSSNELTKNYSPNSNKDDSGELSEDEDEFVWNSRPDVWSDDVRMNALFAPFRNRDLNPLHYDNKIKFWKETICSYCKEKQILQLDVNYLENCFIRKNLKPKCLELVINEMVKEGTFKTRQDILKPKSGLIQTVFNKMVWTPLAWSTSYIIKQTPFSSMITNTSPKPSSSLSTPFSSPTTSSSPDILNQIRSPISSPNLTKEDKNQNCLINVELVEIKSQELMKLLQETIVYRNIDSVIQYEKLFDLAKQIFNKETIDRDLELIVKYLQVNQKLLINDSIVENKTFVKFCLNSNQNVTPLTEIELSYLNLKETEKKIENESNKLYDEIDSLNEKIKVCLKQNNKQLALKHLKKRKQIEKSVDNKEATLNNIQTMIMSMQQADTNKMTYDIYTQSADALKKANESIKIDKLDDTLADIQDVISANTEIEEALARSPTIDKFNYDEKELNAELNELLLASDEEKNSQSKKTPVKYNDSTDKSFDLSDLLANLPSIPIESPKQDSTLKVTSTLNKNL